MKIHLEPNDKYCVQAYSEQEIKVDSKLYQHSLIVCADKIITDWPVTDIKQLELENLAPLLDLNPKVIIIGHQRTGLLAAPATMQALSQKGIGLEVMTIGAACRTFNVLLSERRQVVLGIILP